MKDRNWTPRCCPGIKVPIIPGIMPIQTYATFLRLTKLCGTRVPAGLMADLAGLRVSDSDSALMLKRHDHTHQ